MDITSSDFAVRFWTAGWPAGHRTSDTTVKHSAGVLLRACYSEAKAWWIRNVPYNSSVPIKERSATSTIACQRSLRN